MIRMEGVPRRSFTHCVVDQYVKEVTDFSSQYGSDGSISYVANNIIGKPTLYPDYGDFSAAYCLRTYGHWWSKSDSAPQPIEGLRPLLPPSEDFIDVKYDSAVYPVRVDLYETYHPGSVVRVWGSLEGTGWVLLWAGEPQTGLKAAARIFSPPIDQPRVLINMLRIEFDQRGHSYYSALDAVMLVGSTHSSSNIYGEAGESMVMQIMKMGLHKSMCEEDILSGVQLLLSEESVQKLVEEGHKTSVDELTREEKADLEVNADFPVDEKVTLSTDVTDIPGEENTKGGYFDLLPEEVIMYILRKLDISSLCHLCCTCKLLQGYASDPLLYMTLNLQNCWWLVKNSTLECLSSRCSLLQYLDLSWCGPYGAVDTETFMEFIHACGHQLTVLRVNNCHFIDNYCLYMISIVCPNLKELSMANCNKVDHLGFGELKKARALARLDLTRTQINSHTLQLLLQHTSHLQHLSLNNCSQLDMDEVALTLATFNHNLVSLNAWKTRGLTQRGLRALACIPTLQVLDLGWALSGGITESFAELVRECKGLKILYLSALRTLTDHDLHLLMTHSRNLTQLDIMGTRNITPEAVHRLLKFCTKLKLLDVSFCEQIHYSHVHHWAMQFPQVSIKGGLWHQVRIV